MKAATTLLMALIFFSAHAQTQFGLSIKKMKERVDSIQKAEGWPVGGGCRNVDYKISTGTEFPYEYCFFTMKGHVPFREVAKDLKGFAEVVSYDYARKCLVIRLYDPKTRRQLQGYFTQKFCK